MRRLKQLLWLVAVLIFTAILSFQTATAIFINDIGRDEYVTYFRGQFFTGYAGGTNAGAVFPFPAYTLVNDVNQFVQLTHDYLFNPVPDPIHDANDQIGAAAYVVSSMLGRKGPEFGNDWNVGVQYAKDNWADWESRVRYYDSQGWVNYNDVYTFCSPYVHYNQDYTLSDVFAYEVSSGGCQTDLAITFSRPGPGGGFYRLIKDCGNPNGDQTPLVDPPPPVTASCQPLTPYSSTIMGQPYTFAVSAQVSAWGPPLVSGNPALSVTVR
ncbi:hypothetical protein JNM87_01675, partial [Candidatus Saccharibacteria bacterium]|nr:hypothetical protein [Candidatus Saccharibacteria bacterium]